VAVPIAEQVFLASWAHHAPKSPLAPPSAEISRGLKAMPIDVFTGRKVSPSKSAFMEHFRVTGGKVRDTQHALVARGTVVSQSAPRGHVEEERPVYSGPMGRMASPYPSRPPRTLRELFGLQRF
jgi:hypothetical protein